MRLCQKTAAAVAPKKYNEDIIAMKNVVLKCVSFLSPFHIRIFILFFMPFFCSVTKLTFSISRSACVFVCMVVCVLRCESTHSTERKKLFRKEISASFQHKYLCSLKTERDAWHDVIWASEKAKKKSFRMKYDEMKKANVWTAKLKP